MSTLDRRTFLAAAGAAAAVPSTACGQAGEAGWATKAPLPWEVQEIYCAVVEGMIITAGGLRRGEGRSLIIEDRVGMYLPAEDRWLEGLRLPEPRHHPMLFAADRPDADNYLMVAGGYARSAAGDWTNTTTCWLLRDGEWAENVPLPVQQSEAVGVHFGDRFHLMGGRSPGAANAQWNDQIDTDRHMTYLLDVDVWETARPCPMARNSAAGAVLDGAIWVAGGRTVNGGGTGRLDRYDPQADRWDTLAPIPASSTGQQVGGGLAMAAVKGRLVAFGGEWFQRGGGGGVFRETWIYDPARDAWEAGPEMRTPRHGLAAAAVGDVVYAIAGGEVVSGGRAGGVVEALRL